MAGIKRWTEGQVSRRQVLGQGARLASAITAGSLIGLPLVSGRAASETTITMWGNHPEWKNDLESILSAFEQATPGVKVELTTIPGPDYPAKLQTAVAGGQPSDALGEPEGNILVGASTAKSPSDLPYIDLTGKVDVSGLTDTARGQVEVNGKVYGCPLASYTVGVAYQKPIFAKHNLTPPTTWDELKTVAAQLKKAGETPIVMGGKDGVHAYFMYIGLVSSVLGPDGFTQLRHGDRKLTDPDLVQAAQLLLDLQPYYQAGFPATDYATAKAIFADGRGAMEVAGTADFAGYKQVNPQADLGFIAWPGPAAGKSATNTGMELLYTVSRFSSADKQAAATKLVAWLATTAAQQLVSDKIALPVNKNVTESSDPIRKATVQARKFDVPVWYDLPETNKSLDTATQAQGGLWTGRLTAAQFAAQMQAGIVPSAASGKSA